MSLKKLIKSLRRQGARSTWRILYERIRTRYYMLRMRSVPFVRPTLQQIQLRNRLRTLPIDRLVPIINNKALRSAADSYAQDKLEAFGARIQELSPTIWHTDICLQQTDRTVDVIFPVVRIDRIQLNLAGAGDEQVKDIKVPWELSRLQQLVVLACAFRQYHDEQYAQAVHRQLQHWIEHNPYVHGVNWLCAMEVGIRASNIILALAQLVQADACDDATLHIYLASLYEHMEFIHYHWEWYDGRTSNHYLADLVGYLYLCWLFYDLPSIRKRTVWAYNQIINEMHKQVFAEGTDYEGSTTYHKLVLELFEHAQILLELLDCQLPTWFSERLARMRTFVQWCSYAPSKVVMIGDCDSGSVVWPGFVSVDNRLQQGTMQFGAFGLTILRTERMHISLRHHAYEQRQPSGHFHNDAGSITLAIDGIPVIVDPGSFVYTACPAWRNQFRSASMHNCMSILGHEPTPFDAHLFFLALPENDMDKTVFQQSDMRSAHTLYERLGLKAERIIAVNNDIITICDRWYKIGEVDPELRTQWRLLFHPDIDLVAHDAHMWGVLYNGRQLCKIITDNPMTIVPSWLSEAYGTKVATAALHAIQPIDVEHLWQIRILVE